MNRCDTLTDIDIQNMLYHCRLARWMLANPERELGINGALYHLAEIHEILVRGSLDVDTREK